METETCGKCGEAINPEDGFCKNCWSSEKTSQEIGGWLILVAIGIIFTPIRLASLIITVYPELFSTGAWEALTTIGSSVYSPYWGPIIIFEMFFNTLLLLAWLYMGYKFFTKNSTFPKLYIKIALFSLVFLLVDAFALKLPLPNEPIFDPDTQKELLRALVMVFIWVPYMLVSKRVKATFVK